VYCSSEYVPGASNGLIPIYMLPNVNTRLNLSVQKYLLALVQIDSNGCNASKCCKKLHLNILANVSKFRNSTCETDSS
jgi:hypothetical protein